ncbi:ion channel [Aldersonia sp. NBC_00410]|uniref:potassium channel family protein n=1 Tax=Aldersonia sp. NBC_00410 TaxID=2975954 RepID=UPI00224FC88E|nr:potassium channel family protein [Aldersonia sp. NBC_00410]MCX5046501.1 ion channel [Aldersonia sp. NBC_00410]
MLLLLTRFAAGMRRVFAEWSVPLYIAAFVFLTSWLAMWVAEPHSEIVAPANFPWYFIVTATTVGYGDFFPETVAGHVVGAYVIVGGIVALTMLFTHLVDKISTARGRRMRGLAALEIDDHIVLLGYSAGRTERLVGELTQEPTARVVLCAWDTVAEHPMPDADRVQFVRGDLTDESVLVRACVDRAAIILIDGRDDNETLAVAVAVAHASRSGDAGPTANRVHLIAALRDMSRASQFRYVSSRIQCVQWHVPNLLVEEAHDPGITQVYAELMTAGGTGASTYSLRLSRDHTDFGAVQVELGRRFAAVAVAVRRDGVMVVNPPWDGTATAGTTVYYVAASRLAPAAL